MEVALVILFGIIGSCIGSFLNVCVDRLPLGKSIVSPPSQCDGCHKRLAWFDLIPVFSFLWLRGRCRYCGAKVPWRVPLVEAGCGIWLALLFVIKGLSLDFAIISFYSFVFVVIGLIDFETMLIPNKIVYPAAVLALIINIFLPGSRIISTLIGGAVGFAILFIPLVVTSGRGMGMGDIKMAALIGLITGFPVVFVGVLGGAVLGGLVAIILLVSGLKKRKEAVPFGPFLAVSTIAALVWGEDLIHWYLKFFGK
jgi:leader peptidase (prepilin peptidase) / N-methyltransferase